MAGGCPGFEPHLPERSWISITPFSDFCSMPIKRFLD